MRSGDGRIIAAVNEARAEATKEEVDREGGGADRVRRFDLARTIALSDGVFAFALTLLVLSITVPVLKGAVTSEDVASALFDRGQELVSWVVSFLVIGGFWMRHNALSRRLERVDSRFLVLNLAFLALIAFIPYPTEVMGKYPTTASFVFYATVISLLIIVSASGAAYASAAGLLRSPESPAERRYRFMSAFLPTFFFLLSIPVALLFGKSAGYLCWIALIPADAIFDRLAKRP